jgi:hypothetical protein
MSDDSKRGLYRKYHVIRLYDSTSQPDKHRDCEFYVLDMTHDPHAVPALFAYAESCQATNPKLASDLRNRATNLASWWKKELSE